MPGYRVKKKGLMYLVLKTGQRLQLDTKFYNRWWLYESGAYA